MSTSALPEPQPAWSPEKPVALEGIEILQLWITNVSAVMLIRLAPRVTDPELNKEVLARVLRMVSDGCAQLGRPVPVVGVVCGAAWKERILEWAGDQDWHRGDFALEFWDETASDASQRRSAILNRHLRGVREALPSLAQLRPPQREDYVRGIQRELGQQKTSEAQRDILVTSLHCLETGEPQRSAFNHWLREFQQRAQNAAEATVSEHPSEEWDAQP